MNKTQRSSSLLMVSPDHFQVEYAINPHMRAADGQLQTVDQAEARSQWENLKRTFASLGSQVHVLPAVSGLPDMVFAANQSFPFVNPKTARPTVVMSHMTAPQRRPEVSYFEKWYREQGFDVAHLQAKNLCFEGTGDALLDPSRPLIWGGFGFRTERHAYGEIASRFGFEIIYLKLRSAEFYHLDTCLALLNHETAAVVTSALEDEGLRQIRKAFKNVIEVEPTEALRGFAANCFSPNGRDVVVQKGNPRFVKSLTALGLKAHEVETGEFIKSGGSVFCLKVPVPMASAGPA